MFKLDAKTLLLAFAALSLTSKSKSAQASPGSIVIPKGGPTMTFDQLRELARSVGFPDPDLAAAIAMAESGGHETAVGDKGTSFGLWQIHKPSHPQYEPALLLTPYYNAQAAFAISQQGKSWQPWTTYRNGDYQKYMPKPLAPPEPVAGELAQRAEPDDTTQVSAPPAVLEEEDEPPSKLDS